MATEAKPQRPKLVQHGYDNWRVVVGGVHLGAVRRRPDQITSKWQWTAHAPDTQLLPISLGGYGWARSRKDAVAQLIEWHEQRAEGAQKRRS